LREDLIRGGIDETNITPGMIIDADISN